MRERGETNASEIELADTTLRAYSTLSEAARHATSLRHGDVLIDRYEIGDTLGIGGMGVVFEAFDRIAQEKIAVKVLRGDVGLTGQLQTRFLSEAKVSRTLSHENIVRVYDVGATQDFYYLTMERLWGQSLRARMEELNASGQRFSQSEFNSILCQLIEALRFANRTLVHRDVKPENIWITPEGVIKLMDFGIARVFVDSQVTYTQAIIGTPRYMSPEQRDSPRKVDWRTDQYALGVILHEVLTGKRPEIGMQSPAMLRKDISRGLSDAIVKALAPEPDKRHPTWQAFKEAFEQPLPRRSPWKVGAAGLLLAATIGGAYFFFEPAFFESGEHQLTPSTEERSDVAKQAELARQQRAAAEAASQKAAAESQAREQQAAEAERLAEEERGREAEVARQAEMQREADAKRRLSSEQRAEAERNAELARRAEVDRQAELERQAQLERERQAAQALVVLPAASAPPESKTPESKTPESKTAEGKDKKEKKNRRSLETGLIPPSF